MIDCPAFPSDGGGDEVGFTRFGGGEFGGGGVGLSSLACS